MKEKQYSFIKTKKVVDVGEEPLLMEK